MKQEFVDKEGVQAILGGANLYIDEISIVSNSAKILGLLIENGSTIVPPNFFQEITSLKNHNNNNNNNNNNYYYI